MRIGEQIMKARRKAGLTQAGLAKRLRTRQSNISRLEQGVYNPTLGMLAKIAKALKADLKVKFVKT